VDNFIRQLPDRSGEGKWEWVESASNTERAGVWGVGRDESEANVLCVNGTHENDFLVLPFVRHVMALSLATLVGAASIRATCRLISFGARF